MSALALSLSIVACQKDFDESISESEATGGTQVSFTVTPAETKVEVENRSEISWIDGDQMMFFNSTLGTVASGSILDATVISDVATFSGTVTPTSGKLIGFYPASGSHNNQANSTMGINSVLRLPQQLILVSLLVVHLVRLVMSQIVK
ncbi:MAG: hypothetical protein R3Y68_01520 [Rikenellaceae bacterium]